MKQFTSAHIALAGGALLVGAILGYAIGFNQGNMRYGSDSLSSYSPSSFEECAAAGYPIAESYPRQCRTPDGKVYIEEVPVDVPPSAYIGPGCATGGCSSELCGSEGEMKDVVSTCLYKPEYACYKTARCEKQTNGKCGWTQSNELKSCLQNPPTQ